METEIIINSSFFAAGKRIVGISVLALLLAAGLILISIIFYKNDQRKQKADFMRKREKFAVDVTLDPDTAHRSLILTDGKQVTLGDEPRDVPDLPERFNYPSVLGRGGFDSGKFYYEVQVGMKTEWTLGVVSVNIDRKMWCERNPRSGFWTIKLRNNNEYKANAQPPAPSN